MTRTASRSGLTIIIKPVKVRLQARDCVSERQDGALVVATVNTLDAKVGESGDSSSRGHGRWFVVWPKANKLTSETFCEQTGDGRKFWLSIRRMTVNRSVLHLSKHEPQVREFGLLLTIIAHSTPCPKVLLLSLLSSREPCVQIISSAAFMSRHIKMNVQLCVLNCDAGTTVW